MCPQQKAYELDEDEAGVLTALAEHYRQFEWSPKQARKEGTAAVPFVAIHAVPSLKAPTVVYLSTLPYRPFFDPATQAELERHETPRRTAEALRNGLRSRNAAGVAMRLPKTSPLVGLGCRDLMAIAYTGAKPAVGDLTNGSKALTISLPSFDETRTTALVLSINSLEFVLEGAFRDAELTLLRKTKSGAWRVEWHAVIAEYLSRGELPAATVAPTDYPVFDAVLSHVAQTRGLGEACVVVANQTRVVGLARAAAPREILAAAGDAAADLERRGSLPVYVATYAPRRPAKMVQREVLESIRAEAVAPCKAAIRFSLPGYGPADTAVVVFTLRTVAGNSFETGEGWAVVKRTGGSWRVDRHTYQRW